MNRLAHFMLASTLLLGLTACGGNKSKNRGTATAPATSGTTAAPISSSNTTPGPQTAPAVVVTTPSTTARGNVAINYTLFDGDGDPADLEVWVSVDDGATWNAASDAGPSEGSDGTTGLSTSPGGEAHAFVWSSRADLGDTLRHFVRLRMQARDPHGASAVDETATFTVDDTETSTRILDLVIPLDPEGPDTLSTFDLGALGGPTVNGAARVTAGNGRQMSSSSGIARVGTRVFVGHNRSRSVEVFTLDAAGVLSSRGVTATAAEPTGIAPSPNGRFLFVATSAAVEVFSIGPLGDLTPVPGSPFAVGSSPRGLAVHPRGRVLYTGHMFGADVGVRVHTFDPQTGALTLQSSQTLPGASRPGKHIVIDPQGSRLYVSDLDSGLFGFAVDPLSGDLTALSGFPLSLGGFLSGAVALTTHGEFLYVSQTGGLRAYAVATNGDLRPVPGMPFVNLGATTLYLETDGADTSLFAPSRGDDALRVYAIDRQSGVVTEAPGSPLANPNARGVIGPVLPLR